MKLFKKIAMVFVAVFALVLSLASCNGKTPAGPTVEDAAKRIVLTQDKQTVSGDFQVPSIVKIDGVTFTVTWVSDNPVATIADLDANYKQVKVDYLHNLTAEQVVNLSATISDGTNTLEKEFSFKVPQFIVQTIAQYDAMLDGENTTVHGIVVAKEEFSAEYKNTSIYVAAKDGKGGVYAYRLKCTQEQYDNELVIGANVYISGAKKMYNGLREYDGSCTYLLESSTITTPTVHDVTDLIKAGTKISADYQNQLIKFSGLEILEIGEEDSKGRFNITVGEGENTFVIRVNTYITPTAGDAYKAYKALNLAPGMTISAQGVCGWYNSAQMHPINATDITIEGINYGKVMASELAKKLVIEEALYGVNEIELPTTLEGEEYAGLTATWTSASENVVINGNKATTKLVAADETVVLTVTVKDAEGNVKGTATAEVPLTKTEMTTTVVTAPVVGTEYYFMINQKSLKKDLFITGVLLNQEKGDFLETTDDYKKAIKVQIEAVEGGYALFFMNGETKTYINVTQRASKLTSADITLDAENKTVYTWNTENNTLVTTQGTGDDQNSFYLGSYNTFDTFSAANLSYVSTSYPAHLVTIVEMTDDMRIDKSLEEVESTIGTEVYNAKAELTFELTYPQVTLEVTVQENAKTLVWDAATGKLTITPTEAATEEKLTVKVTIGEKTETIEVNVKACAKIEITSLADAEKAAKTAGSSYSTEVYYVQGVISKVANATYGNVYITDGTTEFYVYGLYSKDGSTRYDKMEVKPQVGDLVTVFGVVGTYKDAVQMKNAKLHSHVKLSTLEEAITAGTTAGDAYSTEKVLIQAEIKSIDSDKYGNVYVTNGTTEFYVYGMYTNDGSTRYDKMEVKPQVGDVVTLYGIVGTYKEKAQMKNSWLMNVVTAEVQDEEKAVEALGKLVKLVETSYTQGAEIELKVEGATLVVTVQENATTLAWDATTGKLTVTPGQTEVTETVTIKITVGEVTKEETISVKSVLSLNTLKTTIKSDLSNNYITTEDEAAAKLSLDPTLFSAKFIKNGCTNANGHGRVHQDDYFQIYGGNYQGATDEEKNNGAALEVKGLNGVVIKSIKITFKDAPKAFTVNGTAATATDKVCTVEINSASFILKSCSSTQLKITSIEVIYEIAE